MIDFIGIELIEFHDLTLKSISIQNEPSFNLVMEVDLWDEEIGDYIQRTLIFGELEHIKTDSISIEQKSDLEINSFDYYMKGNLFFGEMIILTGFGKASFTIKFSCRSVEIKERKSIDVKR